jgi:hypothetical protein
VCEELSYPDVSTGWSGVILICARPAFYSGSAAEMLPDAADNQHATMIPVVHAV